MKKNQLFDGEGLNSKNDSHVVIIAVCTYLEVQRHLFVQLFRVNETN